MLRITPLLFAAALLAQPAHAAVTYSWHQVDASSSMPTGLNLELVFSDQAVAQGALALDFTNLCDLGEPCLDPQDSLLSLRYWYDAPDSGGALKYNLIDFGYRDLPDYYFDHISLDIAFLAGGLLGGSIFATDGNSDFLMQSDGALFSVIAAHSDEWDGCGYAFPDCAGGTGFLRAEAAVGEVPEPSGVALTGLGLAAAWFARRRKR